MKPILVELAVALTISTVAWSQAVPEVERATIVHAGMLLAVPGEAPRLEQSVVIRGGRVDSVHQDSGMRGSRLGRDYGDHRPVRAVCAARPD